MKRISQNEYQKVVEKNKKLLKEIKLLTSEELSFEKIETIQKWRESFKKVDELRKLISQALNPVYEKYDYDYDWSMYDNIISRKFGEDIEFIGTCWFVESIETTKFLADDNWKPFDNFSCGNPHQEKPLFYDAKFTINPQKALKFKTKEAAEYFLCHQFDKLSASCFIKDICCVTEHEFVDKKL